MSRRGREVLAEAGERDLRLLALELAQRVAQELDRDVDRDVAARLEEREQARRLRAVAGAEVDQRDAGADRFGHRRAVVGEDRRLGPRRVVLGELGDRLEQVRAEPVVEELGRDARRAGEQGSARRSALGVGVGEPGLDEAGSLGVGHRRRGSGASRARPRTLPRDRPECSGGQQSSLPPARAEPPSGARRAAAALVGAACLGASPPRRTSFGLACRAAGAAARPRRSRRQALAARRARRQGRGAQLLGHVVRAVPDRDAVARRDGGAPARRRRRRRRGQLSAKLPRSSARSSPARRSSRRSCSTATDDATIAWTPRVFPTTVIVGRDGQPVHVVVGELDWEGAEAKALLDPLVARRRS